jgi:alpha-amylase
VSHKKDYYAHIVEMAPQFAALGFTYVWLPPPTASVSPEGYMPTDYFNLSSCYGDEEGLRRAVAALKANGLKVAGDCVLNHRCALHQDEHGIWNRVRGAHAAGAACAA